MQRMHLIPYLVLTQLEYLAISPMNSEPTNAANAVATKMAPWSILVSSDTPLTPAKLKTCGLTAKI